MALVSGACVLSACSDSNDNPIIPESVYGLAGSVLQNSIHSADPQESGILLFEECLNIILRNLTFKSAGAYDIDATHLNVTFANCWWDEGCSERMPRMRFGKAHVYNCLFTCTGNVYCIGAGYTDYNITMTSNLGADDEKASSGDAPFFVPTYSYKKYDAAKVQEVVGNQRTGAGATMKLL